MPDYSRDAFLVTSSTRVAWTWLMERPPESWPRGHGTILRAPSAGGKTHLGRLWMTRLQGMALPECIPLDETVMQAKALFLDDVEAFLSARPDDAQRWLFHLLNLAYVRHIPVLMTATHPIETWGIKLPDLDSRVRSMMWLKVEDPDDAMMHALIIKHCHDHQMTLEDAVIAWLLARLPRTAQAVKTIIARLDALAMRDKRTVTVPWLATVQDDLHLERDKVTPPWHP